ncbi:MAG: LPXTG cell wall anchor domain-containing protein [Micromonosporaceae bacterium]|nr:LPXTG cell wall anchor domain-containing protein [Micromonosporaceae bacterium]
MRTIRILPALALAAGLPLLGTLALPPSPATAQEPDASYAEWTLAGSGGDYTGTMTLPPAFPAAGFTSDSRAPASLVSGASNWLSGATPFGAEFGSSQDQPYVNLRPAADNADAPSTTTYQFASPTPAGGWGFALGDIDADRVEISATDPDGNPVPAAGLGFQEAFNYCDASPRPSSVCSGGPAPGDPDFDLPTVVVQDESVTLVGNGLDTGGAAGWFAPTVPLSTLTIVFTFQSGFPVYHTWFAALTRSVSGSVVVDGDPLPGAELTLLDPGGDPIASATTDEGGDYQVEGLGPADDYTVVLTVPDRYRPVGPARRTVDLAAGDADEVDFALTATTPSPGAGAAPGSGAGEPGTGVELPRTGGADRLTALAGAGGALLLSGAVAFTLARRRRLPG